MRNLFSMLLVAVLVPVGAQALSAQQAQGTTSAKTTQTPNAKATQTTTHHMRKHHRRHASKMVARQARAEHESVATERHEVRHARRVRHHEAMRSHMNAMNRTNGMVMNREPEVLGTPAAGFPPPPAVTTLPTGNLPRLSNGLITLDAARRIALQTVPGGTSVTKIQRHTEDGRQVYDVKVITPNQTGNEMVRVDAHTGAVVETKNVDNPVGTVKGAVNKAVNKVKHP